MKTKKLKPNQFRCIVCQEIRIRGVYVRTKDPEYMAVKVCKKTDCKKIAQKTVFYDSVCIGCGKYTNAKPEKIKNPKYITTDSGETINRPACVPETEMVQICRSCKKEFSECVMGEPSIRLTKTFIKKVIAHNKKKWHDAKWHEFDRLREVEAVQWALSEQSGQARDFGELLRNAKRYLSEKA